MRGLYKAHGVAQTAQARRDYAWLLNLAAQHGLDSLIPSAGERPGWRKLDKAAEAGIKALLKAKPELRGKLREIYPGLVEAEKPPADEEWREERGDEQCLTIFEQVEQARLVKPTGKCVKLTAPDGVVWNL